MPPLLSWKYLVISVFMALRLVRLRLSPATMPMGFAFTSLNSIAMFIANLTGSVVPGLIFAMFFLLLVVMVRLRIRRVWVADLVASTLLAFGTIGPGCRIRGQSLAQVPIASSQVSLAFLGYGTAITGALAEMLLSGGQGWVALFADNANPTSTGIYRRIGFAPELVYRTWLFE